MIKRGKAGGKDANDKTNSNYGALVDTDVWNVIQTQANNGWFVPSRDEWNAFGAFFKVGGEYSGLAKIGDEATNTSYSDYCNYNNLSEFYWSSSQKNNGCAWVACFPIGFNVRLRLRPRL